MATTRRRVNGKVYETHLLRRSYREAGKVKHQTLGNISHLPPDLIETIRRRLRGKLPPGSTGGFRILRAWPHGHVVAALGTLRRIGLDRLIASRASLQRTVAVALVVSRIIDTRSKLATAWTLQEETATSSLALELGLQIEDERTLYEAMDWLVARQQRIENKLARRRLKEGSLVLYDVSSSYYTDRHCTLANFGHPRDGVGGFPQIVYGLLCNGEGCPVAIEVFEGNTADPMTLPSQIQKIRKRFALERVVLVGDRGMITSKRINETLRGIEGLEWITALRSEAIRKLLEQGAIQLSLFDERDLVEVQSPEYPGERLVVCRNPLLAEERARKRRELLAATQKQLDLVVAANQRANRPLRGKEKIGLRVGKILNRYKVGKHFLLDITEERFSYRRNEAKIAAEAAFDGLYVIRTSVSPASFSAKSALQAYKDLSKVERAFRCLKTVDLKVRPIHHWLENRVRAHVFLCMLAYYVEWHMRQKLALILFEEDEKATAQSLRRSIVAPAQRSPSAKRKDRTKRTEEDLPIGSFQGLLKHLATLTKNRVRARDIPACEFYELPDPTVLQSRAFELLEVTP